MKDPQNAMKYMQLMGATDPVPPPNPSPLREGYEATMAAIDEDLTSSVKPWLVGGLFGVMGLLLLAAPALAKDFTVDTVLDLPDANPGDGVCETAPRTPSCSLRAAIQEANALGGVHTITLPAGTYQLSIAGAEDGLNAAIGDLDIVNSHVTVCGAGADSTIIDANQLDRVFQVFTSASLGLCDVTIQNGQTDGGGGAILNLGTLDVTNSRIIGNSAQGAGGGILNIAGGELTITHSTVSENSTAGGGGGIFNTGTATIQDSVIAGNSGQESGGGIASVAGSHLSIIRTTVSGNSAAAGGGVSNVGTATIHNSTISGNFAHSGAGAFNGASLTVTNSTISGNEALLNCGLFDSCTGGGLLVSPTGSTEIVNGTIVQNEIANPPNVPGAAGIANFGSVTTKNSIVADCAPPVTSAGHNLDSGGTCGLSAPGDLVGLPLLGPLAANGGPTRTHALLPASPAIDAAAGCPLTDQRGLVRPPACDIGAYERGFSPDLAVTKTVNCEQVNAGGRVVFQLTVTNFGPRAHPKVQLTDRLPAGLILTSVRASRGRCATSGRDGGVDVICQLGGLPPDGSAEVEIEALTTDAGILENVALVTGALRETDLANNTARTTTIVVARDGRT